MARYLLTGVAGFIASRVGELLLEDGHTVVGVDNLNDAYDVRLKQWRLGQIQGHPNLHFHQLDICHQQAMDELFASAGPFEAVINLAARAGVRPSVTDPWSYYETNLTGALNLLELCRQHDIPKFVLASTSSLYGDSREQPFREDMLTNRALSPYAASKKAAETLCYTYHHLYGLDVTVFRYFTVYGPAGRPDMSLFRFVQWTMEGRPLIVYGDGKQSRDFTYVDDVARGTIAGLAPVGYDTFNLGSDRPWRLEEVIRLISEAVGKQPRIEYRPRHPADVAATWADINRARQQLGWAPQWTLQEGIARLVQWYRDNRDWTRHISTDPS